MSEPVLQTPQVSIAPAIVDDVCRSYNYTKEEALSVIATHAAILLDGIGNKKQKHFWSTLDTQALFVLLDNKIINRSTAKQYVEYLHEFEEWLESAKLKPSERQTLDRMVFFFDFCFAKHTLRGFQKKLETIVQYYDEYAFAFKKKLLNIAIAHLVQIPHHSTDGDQKLNAMVAEVVDSQLKFAHKAVREIPEKRLLFMRTKIQELEAAGGVAPATTPEPAQSEPAPGQRKTKKKVVKKEDVDDDDAAADTAVKTKVHKRRTHKKRHHEVVGATIPLANRQPRC